MSPDLRRPSERLSTAQTAQYVNYSDSAVSTQHQQTAKMIQFCVQIDECCLLKIFRSAKGVKSKHISTVE